MRPWLFAFVGVASLCLTQMFYYYFRGANSIYVDYERGCGEWCFEGEPTLLQYFLYKFVSVAFGFVATILYGAHFSARKIGRMIGTLTSNMPM